MIYFLYGSDSYRSQKKLNEIVNSYKKIHKSGLDLKIFEGKNFSFNDFKTDTEQISMFKESKLIILRDIFSNKEFKEKFLEKKEEFLKTDNVIVFHQSEDFSKKDSLYSFLRKKNKRQEFQEFIPFKEVNLRKWIKIKLHELQGSIEDKALNELIVFVGNDLWRMENEIYKLVNFKEGKEVTVEDIYSLVRPKIETDIFKTIEAIAFRDKKKALELFQFHLDEGVKVPYLLSMIAYQFRVLLIMKDLIERGLSISQNSSLHPFVIRKTRPIVDQFTFSELKKIYRRILKIDADIKVGRIEPRTAIDLLIIEL